LICFITANLQSKIFVKYIFFPYI